MAKYLTIGLVAVIMAGLGVIVAISLRPVEPVQNPTAGTRPAVRFDPPREYVAVGLHGEVIFEESLTAIAVGPDDRLYAAGDSEVRIFDHCAREVGRFEVASPPLALVVAGTDIYIGQVGQVEKRSADGTGESVPIGRDTIKTVAGLAVIGGQLFVADPQTHRIYRFGADGAYLGDITPGGEREAFRLPSGRIDLAVDAAGNLAVAHSGVHRVDTFSPSGERVGKWGKFSSDDPAGFPGCCNPVNVAAAPTGEIVTAEKGPPRVKVFSTAGELLGLIDSENFHPGNTNMDLAVDSGGRIYVADTKARSIRLFALPG